MADTEPLTPDAVRALIDEIRRDHVPREVIFGYPIEPGETVRPEYVETCMCGESMPCITLRAADSLEASLPREDADAVMRLSALLRDYRDGDEHGWAAEFDFLASEHAAKLDLLSTSVQEVGIQVPILLGNDGRVWDGHHRLAVASRLGIATVPVRFIPASRTVETAEEWEYGVEYLEPHARGFDVEWTGWSWRDDLDGAQEFATDRVDSKVLLFLSVYMAARFWPSR